MEVVYFFQSLPESVSAVQSEQMYACLLNCTSDIKAGGAVRIVGSGRVSRNERLLPVAEQDRVWA